MSDELTKRQDLDTVDKQKRQDHGPEKAEDTTNPLAFANLPDDKRIIKETQIRDSVVKKFNAWDGARTPYERTWDEIYRLYINQIRTSKIPTRSTISVPIIFQIIEAAIPKIVAAIFSQDESFFEVIPFDVEENAIEAEMIQMLLEYQLSRANFFSKFIDFTKQLLLYGTSYFKVYWLTKRDWVWDRTMVRKKTNILGWLLDKDNIEWKDTKEYKIVERRPEVEFIDILDVFPDPEARPHATYEPDVIVRSWVSYEEFLEMGKGKFPVYANTERADIKTRDNTFANSRQTRSSARGELGKGTVDENLVELLEFWGRWDVDGDGIREHALITIANRRVVVQAKPNPFHHQKSPLLRTVLFPVPGEWYGIGLVEPVISMKHELDTLRRQRLDNVNQVLNAMWKVNSMADVDTETLFSGPNNIILTDDMEAVERMEGNDVTASAYTEAGIVQRDIENATSPSSIQGTPASGKLGRTARGAQLIIGQALEKFGLSVKLIEEMGIKPVLRMFHQLNLQMIDTEDILKEPRLYGHLFNEVTPEDLRADVEFKMVSISEMIGTEAKINQAISYMSIFGKVLSPETIDSVAKMVWKLMGFNPRDIQTGGMPPPPGREGDTVDRGLQDAINGQAQNQGLEAGAAVPGAPSV